MPGATLLRIDLLPVIVVGLLLCGRARTFLGTPDRKPGDVSGERYVTLASGEPAVFSFSISATRIVPGEPPQG